MFAAAFRALKPGGVLGVEEHRNKDPQAKPGKDEADTGEVYAGVPHRVSGFQARRPLGDQREPEGHQGLPQGRLDAAAELRRRREGPRQVRGDRRIESVHAEVREAAEVGPRGDGRAMRPLAAVEGPEREVAPPSEGRCADEG